jgi:hypothetical protein
MEGPRSGWAILPLFFAGAAALLADTLVAGLEEAEAPFFFACARDFMGVILILTAKWRGSVVQWARGVNVCPCELQKLR